MVSSVVVVRPWSDSAHDHTQYMVKIRGENSPGTRSGVRDPGTYDFPVLRENEGSKTDERNRSVVLLLCAQEETLTKEVST